VTIREIRGKNISPGIQRATQNQAESLTEIAFAAKRHWGYPERWIQSWSPILTITPHIIEQNETYVAFLDNVPVGFCAISIGDKKASVEHMWVLPDHMGKGIGAKLFLYMLSRCKEVGARTLEIESDPNAQGFYEHMGANKVGEVVGEVDGQPRVLPLLEIKL
jgi:GNAT superfamily N-acetyltransferase